MKYTAIFATLFLASQSIGFFAVSTIAHASESKARTAEDELRRSKQKLEEAKKQLDQARDELKRMRLQLAGMDEDFITIYQFSNIAEVVFTTSLMAAGGSGIVYGKQMAQELLNYSRERLKNPGLKVNWHLNSLSFRVMAGSATLAGLIYVLSQVIVHDDVELDRQMLIEKISDLEKVVEQRQRLVRQILTTLNQ